MSNTLDFLREMSQVPEDTIRERNEITFPPEHRRKLCGTLATLIGNDGIPRIVRFYCGDEVHCSTCRFRKVKEVKEAWKANIIPGDRIKVRENIPEGNEAEALKKRAKRDGIKCHQQPGKEPGMLTLAFAFPSADIVNFDKEVYGEDTGINTFSDTWENELATKVNLYETVKIAHERGKKFAGKLVRRASASGGSAELREDGESSTRIAVTLFVSSASQEQIEEEIKDIVPDKPVSDEKSFKKGLHAQEMKLRAAYEAMKLALGIEYYTKLVFRNVYLSDVIPIWNEVVQKSTLVLGGNSKNLDIVPEVVQLELAA